MGGGHTWPLGAGKVREADLALEGMQAWGHEGFRPLAPTADLGAPDVYSNAPVCFETVR